MLRPSIPRGSIALRRSGRLSCSASSRSTSGRSASFSPSRRCLSVSATRSARSRISSIQRCTSSGRRRLRHEFGKLAVAGEREMHLADAPSGLRHVAQIGDLLLAFAGMLGRRQADAARRQSGRDSLMSRSRRRPDWRRSCGRCRLRFVLSPSTSSTLPSSAGVLAKPTISVRKRPISISGLMPVSSFR